MFSQLYLGYAILYHKEKFGLNNIMYNICLSELNKEFCESFKHLKMVLPLKTFILTKLSCRSPRANYMFPEDKSYLSNLIWRDIRLRRYVEEQIHIDSNVLGKIKQAMLTKDEDLKEKLVDDIISVGEYPKNY